jgi:hypothetical protein
MHACIHIPNDHGHRSYLMPRTQHKSDRNVTRQQFDDGEIVGHRIFSLEESRRLTAARKNGGSNMQAGSVHSSPHKTAGGGVDSSSFSVPRGPQDGKEEWLRKHHAQVVNREEQVKQQVLPIAQDRGTGFCVREESKSLLLANSFVACKVFFLRVKRL